MDQATHYINNKAAPNASSKKKKKVVLSTSLNVQLHVLLTGEDDDEIEEETYEEWNEEMLDDDDMDEDIEQHTEKQQQKQQANTEEDEDDDDDKPLQQSMHKNSQILDSKNNLHHDETKDALQNQHRIKEPTAVNNHADPVRHPSREQVPVNSKVLRVFAGNVDVGASYHSVRVTESTSVDELLMSAMEKFHISQIETKNGRSHGKNSGVEYYHSQESGWRRDHIGSRGQALCYSWVIDSSPHNTNALAHSIQTTSANLRLCQQEEKKAIFLYLIAQRLIAPVLYA